MEYGFGFSQEDDRVEAAVLAGATRVVSVASGGEVPLGLAARGAEVDAVDVDAGQLHLVALKLATVRALDPGEAAGFLGYATMTPGRRLALWPAVAPLLSPDALAAWVVEACEEGAIGQGALWAGRFERYLRRVVGPLRTVWGQGAIEALCRAGTREEQARVYDARIDRPWVRLAFWLAFHPALYARRGIDPKALAQRRAGPPLGEQYRGWFRHFCTATPALDNWFLQLVLRGALLDPTRGPDFLRAEGVDALRAHPERVRLHQGELTGFLEVGAEAGRASGSARWDGAHLSNLGDWMDEAGFGRLLGAVARGLAPGAPFVWRELQVERSLPEGEARLTVDRAAGERRREGDRFPFYRIVPGRRGGG